MFQLVKVIGGAVNGVDLHGLVPGVDQIVVRPGGNHDACARPDLVADTINHDLSPALLDPKKLVMRGMGFRADVLTGLESHQNKLQVVTGVKDMAKILVRFCQILDVRDIAGHICSPFGVQASFRIGRRPAEGRIEVRTCARKPAAALIWISPCPKPPLRDAAGSTPALTDGACKCRAALSGPNPSLQKLPFCHRFAPGIAQMPRPTRR